MALKAVEAFVTSTDNSRIYAKAVGDSRKPSIIFVHGIGLSSIVFHGVLSDARLLENFYLVAYDMRGHGRSDMLSNMDSHSSKLYADDFTAVCNHFGLKAPIYVGWSLGATVVCDICLHIGKNAISKVVYVAALPFIGKPVQEIGTPATLELLPGLFSTNDVSLFREARAKFIEGIFNNSPKVPVDLKWSWLGCMMLQPPEISYLALSRPQDPTKLFEAGAAGLPLLLIVGEADQQANSDAIIRLVKPKFSDLRVVKIANGSHAVFIEKQREFVDALLGFVL